jgi:hypothetical protein
MRKNRVLPVTILISLLLISGGSFANAAAKSGSTCSKFNQTSGSGTSKLTCTRVNGKLQWSSSSKTNSVGTVSNPVPMGTAQQAGDFTYRIDGIEFGIDQEICKTNSFNSGCTRNDDFDGIVDPNSTFNWAAVRMTATNKTDKVAKPAELFMKTFSLVLPNGQLLKSEYFALGDEDFSKVEVIPGGTGTGRLFFQIPKSIKSLKTLMVIRSLSFSTGSKDYYFTLAF